MDVNSCARVINESHEHLSSTNNDDSTVNLINGEHNDEFKKIILRNPATKKCFIDIMHVYKRTKRNKFMSLDSADLLRKSQVTAFTFKQFYFHVTMTIFGRKYLDQYLSRITGIFEIKIQLL